MSSEGTNAPEAQLQLFGTNLDLLAQELMMDEEVPTHATGNFGNDELMNVIHPTDNSVAKRPRPIFEIGDGEDSWNVSSNNIPPPPPQQFYQQDGPSATAMHNHSTLMGGELEKVFQTPFPAPETLFDIPPIHVLRPQMYQYNDVGANYRGHNIGGSFNITPQAVQGTMANFGSDGNYYQPTSYFPAQLLGESIAYPQVQGYPQMSYRAEVSAPMTPIPSAQRPPIPILQHLYPHFSNGQSEMIPSQGPTSFYHGESSSNNHVQINTPQLLSIPPIQTQYKIEDNSPQMNCRVLSNPPIQAPQEMRNNSSQTNIRVLSTRSIQTPQEMRNNSSQGVLVNHPIQTLLERRNNSSQMNIRLLSTPSIQTQHEIRNNSPQRNVRMRMTLTENQESGEIQVNSELSPTDEGIEIPPSPTAEYSLYDRRYQEMGLHIDPHMRMYMLLPSWRK